MVESLLSTLGGLPGSFPKSCLEQLFCREPFNAWFCVKELHRRRYLKNFPDILKHKAKTPVRNLVRSLRFVALEDVGCKSETVKREFLEIR